MPEGFQRHMALTFFVLSALTTGAAYLYCVIGLVSLFWPSIFIAGFPPTVFVSYVVVSTIRSSFPTTLVLAELSGLQSLAIGWLLLPPSKLPPWLRRID
jgi:hypothetical protein